MAIKKILYMVCTLMLVSSCNKEIEEFKAETPDVGIVLKLSTDKLTKATQESDFALNETKIERLDVFFFPKDALDSDVATYVESSVGLTLDGSTAYSHLLTVNKDTFIPNAEYDIYIIANRPLDVTIPTSPTLSQLKSLRTVTEIVSSSVQSSFIMDGKATLIANPTIITPIVNVSVSLKRAASKIRVTINFAPDSPVAAATVAIATLKNLRSMSSLLEDIPYSTAQLINSQPLSQATTTTFIFYAYENNWGTNSENETYITLNIPYGLVTENYYNVSVNRFTDLNTDSENPSGVNNTGKIERNRIYDITTTISGRGSDIESGAIDLESNYSIIDWTTHDIILKVTNQHYLAISENNISMTNINSFTLLYVSDLPISITNVTATCEQYNVNGSTTAITYTSTSPQFPTFAINTDARTIKITSSIPINYVPKLISFTVTNNVGLSLNATIIQYPARYVTMRLSSGNVKPFWSISPSQNNFNLATVNTLVPSNNGSYTLGDPTNGLSKTDSTLTGNTIISPRFIIASQYGVYKISTYDEARDRCFLYGEDIYRSGWRMPTRAEIEIINAIQDDPNSAIKQLLIGPSYWSGHKYSSFSFSADTWTPLISTNKSFVRCVYDIYKNE